MDIDQLRAHCHTKKGVSEDFPFDEHTLAIRVMGKIFVLVGLDRSPMTCNLKCDPDYAIELRERFPEVQPGYHMNKKWWNTVEMEGSLDLSMMRSLIDHSYEQVVKTMKKSEQAALAAL